MKKEKKPPVLHDIVFQVKENTYIHKYKEPFIAKHLDDAMEVLEVVIGKRKSCIKRKIYGEFIDNKFGSKYEGPKKKEDYSGFAAAICVSEKDIYDAIVDIRILAPAIVDVLGGLWWSVTNGKEDIRDKEGAIINE